MDFRHLALVCLRLYLLNGTCMAWAIFLFTRILKRRRGYGLLAAYVLAKVFLVDFCASFLLPVFYPGQSWMAELKTATILLFSVASYFVLYNAVEASFLRTAIVAMLCEVLSILPHYCGFGLLNLLEGQTVWARGEFVWPDLMYPLVAACAAWLLWKLAGPWLIRLRTCRLRMPGLLWTLFLCYISLGTLSNLASDTHNYGIPFWSVLVVFLLFFLLLIGVTVRYRQQVREEARRLRTQQRFAMTHYQILQTQLENMGPLLAQMDCCLEAIPNQPGSSLLTQQYLSALKQGFQTLKAGIYCGDWETDAILCARAEQYSALGIPWEFHFQGYDRRGIASGDVVGLLLPLTGVGLDSQSFSLHASLRKQRLVLHFRAEGIQKKVFPRQALRRILRRYAGTCHLTREENALTGTLTLALPQD